MLAGTSSAVAAGCGLVCVASHVVLPSCSAAGDWALLWTSEASVHNIVKGQVLGAPVTAIQQSIDLQ